jgi:hypothetical protein
MLKAAVMGTNGRALLVLGLSYANLDHLRSGPGDSFLKVDGSRLGLDIDVMIFSGATEADMAGTIVKADGIGPDTTVIIDPKLKS